MKVALINGSPKRKDSASGELLRDLKSCFSENVVCEEFSLQKPKIENELMMALEGFDALVFAYPLYVDGIPSHLLACLYALQQTGIQNKNRMVYGIANSGFYEGTQNAIALEILKNWCEKVGLQWGMGVGVGGGGAISQMAAATLGKGPKRSLARAFHMLKTNIENKTSAENCYISVDFPSRLYKMGAELGWKHLIKKNGLTAKDLDNRL